MLLLYARGAVPIQMEEDINSNGNDAFFHAHNFFCSISLVVLYDLIPIMWVMLFVHMIILPNKQKSYSIPPPFTFHALKVLFYMLKQRLSNMRLLVLFSLLDYSIVLKAKHDELIHESITLHYH